MEYLLLQMLNGLQLGLLLFLLAAGLTLIFGIMDLVNLAHGSLYMMGAYLAWTLIGWTDSFVLGALLALPATLAAGRGRSRSSSLRRLYARDHLDQVLATFGLILFFNELVRAVWGPRRQEHRRAVRASPHHRDPARACPIPPTASPSSPSGGAVALLLAWLVARTRAGHADPRRRLQPRA